MQGTEPEVRRVLASRALIAFEPRWPVIAGTTVAAVLANLLGEQSKIEVRLEVPVFWRTHSQRGS
jgi:hypothetical protein